MRPAPSHGPWQSVWWQRACDRRTDRRPRDRQRVRTEPAPPAATASANGPSATGRGGQTGRAARGPGSDSGPAAQGNRHRQGQRRLEAARYSSAKRSPYRNCPEFQPGAAAAARSQDPNSQAAVRQVRALKAVVRGGQQGSGGSSQDISMQPPQSANGRNAIGHLSKAPQETGLAKSRGRDWALPDASASLGAGQPASGHRVSRRSTDNRRRRRQKRLEGNPANRQDDRLGRRLRSASGSHEGLGCRGQGSLLEAHAFGSRGARRSRAVRRIASVVCATVAWTGTRARAPRARLRLPDALVEWK